MNIIDLRKNTAFILVGQYGMKNDPKETSLIKENLEELHSRYVFLALNISAPLTKTWSNFHGGKHDRKLVRACNRTHLRGSYITDIFKGIENPDSSALKNIPEDIIMENVHFFEQEMKDVKVNDDTIFILLGTKTSLLSNYFNKYFKKNYGNNKVINYYHYSYYGITDNNWVNGLLENKDLGGETHVPKNLNIAIPHKALWNLYPRVLNPTGPHRQKYLNYF